jgi:hypothetical protein
MGTIANKVRPKGKRLPFVKKQLIRAIERAAKIVESTDDDKALRAISALSTAAGTFGKLDYEEFLNKCVTAEVSRFIETALKHVPREQLVPAIKEYVEEGRRNEK